MKSWIGLWTIAVMVIGSACGSKPAPDVPTANTPSRAESVAPPAPPPPPAAPVPPAAPLTEEERFARMSLDDLNRSRPLGEVFFRYDSASIDPDAAETLVRNAAWLRRWTSTSIRVEGHADERGTAEYNLSLSNARATVVRDYLTSLGIAPDRVRIVGLGKEQPQCTDARESCWQQNRRGHAVVVAK
jgi:peptidoglycan-associated lipoprotein